MCVNVLSVFYIFVSCLHPKVTDQREVNLINSLNMKIILSKQNLAVIIMFLLYSCQAPSEKVFYDSGELRYEQTLVNKEKHLYYLKSYYKNGNLRQEGLLYEDLRPEGYWREYYSDGVLRWNGYYQEGCMVILDSNKQVPLYKNYNDIAVEVKNSEKKLKLHQTYPIRILSPRIHRSMYKITYLNYDTLVANPTDTDLYPYLFEVKELYNGKAVLQLVSPNQGGVILAGDTNRIFFDFEVED